MSTSAPQPRQEIVHQPHDLGQAGVEDLLVATGGVDDLFPWFDRDRSQVELIEMITRLQPSVIAVGNGRAWLDGQHSDSADDPTLDAYPMNAALAALGK